MNTLCGYSDLSCAHQWMFKNGAPAAPSSQALANTQASPDTPLLRQGSRCTTASGPDQLHNSTACGNRNMQHSSCKLAAVSATAYFCIIATHNSRALAIWLQLRTKAKRLIPQPFCEICSHALAKHILPASDHIYYRFTSHTILGSFTSKPRAGVYVYSTLGDWLSSYQADSTNMLLWLGCNYLKQRSRKAIMFPSIMTSIAATVCSFMILSQTGLIWLQPTVTCVLTTWGQLWVMAPVLFSIPNKAANVSTLRGSLDFYQRHSTSILRGLSSIYCKQRSDIANCFPPIVTSFGAAACSIMIRNQTGLMLLQPTVTCAPSTWGKLWLMASVLFSIPSKGTAVLPVMLYTPIHMSGFVSQFQCNTACDKASIPFSGPGTIVCCNPA